jgi:hypothetical protein
MLSLIGSPISLKRFLVAPIEPEAFDNLESGLLLFFVLELKKRFLALEDGD